MATISNLINPAAQNRHLRPFDIRKDLRAVADLVEESFRETIDADGRRYLGQMRDAAQNPGFLRWAGSMVESVTLPLWGYVWEEDGRVVGNLSLIPFTVQGQRRYLIANVAVHPHYRRQGIGRALTANALEHVRKRHAAAAWLHVREENEGAIELYRSLGFEERTRRTTWHSDDETQEDGPSSLASVFAKTSKQVAVVNRRAEDWPQQQVWLDTIYPPDLAWHIPINRSLFKPGPFGTVQRLFTLSPVRQWSAYRQGALQGVVAWKNTSTYTDTLWLATGAQPDEDVVYALLAHAHRRAPTHLTLSLDYPAHVASQAIQAAGFINHQTLIWMSVDM